jgi:hypothetical protein
MKNDWLMQVAETFCAFLLKMENVQIFAEAILNKPAQTQR